MFHRLSPIYTLTISLFLLLFLGFLFTQKVNAASSGSISINMVPENPEPYENVDINLSSYENNLDTVNITWSVNDKILLSGIGKKSFSINAPGPDGEATLVITVNLPDGDVNLRVLIKPSNTTLLWQADDSYVPPFYRGKALPTSESNIKIVAMPEIKSGGNLINAKNMSYSWQRDYSNDAAASGYGKNYYIYTNDYLEDNSTVSVNALTVDQRYATSGSVTVNSYEPKIIFYVKDSKMGTLWEKAIPNNYLIKNDEIIEADPYFISPQNPLSPLLTWTWFINNEQISLNSFRKNLLPVKVGTGMSGNAKIGLQIDNRLKIFQTATKELNVQF